MVDYDILYYTPIYNWSVIPESNGTNCNSYIIYCRSYGGWKMFVYYKKDKKLKLPGDTMIFCDTFDKANKIVYDILKCYRWSIHSRYLGRYFKIHKLMSNNNIHNIMDKY